MIGFDEFPARVGEPLNTEELVTRIASVGWGSETTTPVDENGTRFVTRGGFFYNGRFNSTTTLLNGAAFGIILPPQIMDSCYRGTLQDWVPDGIAKKTDMHLDVIWVDGVRIAIKGTFGVFLKDADKANDGDLVLVKMDDFDKGGGALKTIHPSDNIPANYLLTPARVWRDYTQMPAPRSKNIVGIRIVDNVSPKMKYE